MGLLHFESENVCLDSFSDDHNFNGTTYRPMFQNVHAEAVRTSAIQLQYKNSSCIAVYIALVRTA